MDAKRTLMVVGLVALAGALVGCKRGAGLGEACTATSDCKEPLVCDTMSDTCQNAGGTDASPGTDATGPGSDATGPGTDATGPGTDATGPGTDATAPGTDAAAVMCSMTGNDCTDWCTAYLANCSADNNFPAGYDTAMCLSDCAALSPANVDCRAYHACFSGTFPAGSASRDSHCDHAIGLAVCG